MRTEQSRTTETNNISKPVLKETEQKDITLTSRLNPQRTTMEQYAVEGKPPPDIITKYARFFKPKSKTHPPPNKQTQMKSQPPWQR